MSLYSISEELINLSQLLDENVDENGEINPEYLARLEESENKITDKTDNYVGFLMSIEADVDKIKSIIEKLQATVARKEKTKENLKKYVLNVMERLGKDTLDGTIGQLKITKSTATIIEDETKLPEKFRKVEQIPASERITYPKADIKKAIESGEEVPGAHLEFRKDVKIK